MKQFTKTVIPLFALLLILGIGNANAEDGLLNDSAIADESSNQKRFSIRLSPLVLLVAAINVEADIRITDNLTVGPMITYWGFDLEGDSWLYTGYGVRANWYFSKAMEGAYISPFFKRYGLAFSTSNGEEASLSLDAFGGIVGYQFLWDSVNMNLEFGYGVFGSDVTVEVRDSTGNYLRTEEPPPGVSGGVVFDWTVGFSF